MTRILDRYVARELVLPFVWGVASFSLILLGTERLADFVRLAASGVPFGDVLRWFLYSVPRVVVLTFPMAMLLSTLLAFGRLSGDSEVVAAYAGGVSFYRFLWPVLLVSTAVCIITFGFNEGLVPWTRHQADNLYEKLAGKQAQQKGVFLPEYDPQDPNRLVRLITANRFDPKHRTLEGVNLFVWNKDTGRATAWVVADEAQSEIQRHNQLMWTFRHGVMYVPQKDTVLTMQFAQKNLYIGRTPADIDASVTAVKPDEMTYWRLARYLAEQRRRGAPKTFDLLDAELNLDQKLSMPFTSLIFALIGAPMGMRPNRGNTSLGLGLSVIVIFFFYVIGHYMAILADSGTVSPFAAAWLPDLVGMGMGGALVLRAPK